MKKYYYQQGMCTANHYNSLNPVEYESTETKGVFQKVKMVCSCIEKGECDKALSCELLLKAPETLIDNDINLRNKNL